MLFVLKEIHMNLKVASLVFVSLYAFLFIPSALKDASESATGFVHEGSEVALDRPKRSKSTDAIPPVKTDGTFNGFALHKVDRPPRTDIHCVGENFQEAMGYVFRSCRFETFCFDTKLKDFVVYPQKPMEATIDEKVWSSTHNPKEYTSVAAGAQNKLWWPIHWNDRDGKKSRVGKYQPKFVYPDDDDIPSSYYRFNATWLPFYRHQRSAYNPGHLVWDDFLGLYTLLDIFDQTDDNLMLTHMIRKATGDFEGDAPPPDFDVLTKFMPLFTDRKYDIQTLEGNYSLKLKEKDGRDKERFIICADNGLIGSGVHADHGHDHWHGHSKRDFKNPHNKGRGGLFRRYRQWMMEHIGIDPRTPVQRDPYLIIVSEKSTRKKARKNVTFDNQVKLLKKHVGGRAMIKQVQLSTLSLTEQVELLSRTAVFISATGGGTVTGTFLPKGASIVLYHAKRKPLDWDFWNNFGQVRAHWFPVEQMHDDKFMNSLVETVEKQLDYLDRH